MAPSKGCSERESSVTVPIAHSSMTRLGRQSLSTARLRRRFFDPRTVASRYRNSVPSGRLQVLEGQVSRWLTYRLRDSAPPPMLREGAAGARRGEQRPPVVAGYARLSRWRLRAGRRARRRARRHVYGLRAADGGRNHLASQCIKRQLGRHSLAIKRRGGPTSVSMFTVPRSRGCGAADALFGPLGASSTDIASRSARTC